MEDNDVIFLMRKYQNCSRIGDALIITEFRI